MLVTCEGNVSTLAVAVLYEHLGFKITAVNDPSNCRFDRSSLKIL